MLLNCSHGERSKHKSGDSRVAPLFPMKGGLSHLLCNLRFELFSLDVWGLWAGSASLSSCRNVFQKIVKQFFESPEKGLTFYLGFFMAANKETFLFWLIAIPFQVINFQMVSLSNYVNTVQETDLVNVSVFKIIFYGLEKDGQPRIACTFYAWTGSGGYTGQICWNLYLGSKTLTESSGNNWKWLELSALIYVAYD